MGIFDFGTQDHEQVVFCNDPATGLKAIIAIHDTTLGPALGGCRFWNYKSEEDAIFDVMRLSRGMTYKAAVAGLDLGGGKSVIIGDPAKLKSEDFFRAFGRFINNLNGRYITAEDVNIKVEDMNIVAKETSYVTGISSRPGGSGDPSPITALGVFAGIKACVKHKLGKNSVDGLTIAVQGVGSVGHHLCQYLSKEGAKLIVADINNEAVKAISLECNAQVVSVDEIVSENADVFSPCALGGILNDASIAKIKAPIIAGAANNQLLDEDRHDQMLVEKGILYAPDYVINAGGLINVAHELKGYNADAAKKEALGIYDTMLKIFNEAEKKKIPTHKASNSIAEARLKEAGKGQSRRLDKNFDNQAWITV
ncbi:MAG: Glu/Leu/Phe/Val dehydrogenase [Bdellovibrionota bacterium]